MFTHMLFLTFINQHGTLQDNYISTLFLPSKPITLQLG
jgi:hypothetical protein